MTHPARNGFTLIELAIALMVIGLLIGGVLKGQELIENAKITKTVRDLKSYDSAIMIFRNTYGAWPGDIRNPGARVPNCDSSFCSDAGSGNGLIDSVTERYNFFPHLTKAGMIQGPVGGSVAPSAGANDWENYYPATPHAPYISVYQFGGEVNAYWTTQGNFLYSPKVALQLDEKMDDGKPHTGEIVAITVVTPLCFITVSGVTVYNATEAGLACGLHKMITF